MELAKLGRYELRNVLGKGAMGVVYEGFDTTLSRRVAVKTILKSVGLDPETVRDYAARFEREAKAVARFNHPNIVQVYDFGEENEVAYLVMEFIEGRELRSFFVENMRFELREAVRIMGELLDALHFAHEAGVIHRDVKPANVMIDKQMRVKLADFGVSRIQENDQSQVGTMVGTPAFMSPEQIAGGKIDRRTDVFSAGTILYQLLTGDQPFKGGGAWTVAKMIMEEDPPSPSTKVFSVSPMFDAIVNKALAKKPEERYQSAKEFAGALRETLELVSPTVVVPKAVEASASEAEVEFWRSIQNSTDLDEFEVYLAQFPKGAYAALAKHKLSKLREQAEEAARKTARLEAEARAKREAEEAARLESEKRARQDAALAKMRADAAAAPADPEATVAFSRPAQKPAAAPLPQPPPPARKSFALPAVIGAVVVIASAGAFFALNRASAPAPVVEAPKPAVVAPAPAPVAAAAPAPAAPAVDEARIRKEVEERLRKEFADKSGAELANAKAAAEKLAVEKTQAEKVLAEKLAAAKNSGERAALEKAAADKAAAEKLAAEKEASEKAVADKIASEKAASEKHAAEKAAADKASAEKTAAAAAPKRTGVPSVGDKWVYEARDSANPAQRFPVTFEIKAVNGSGIAENSQGAIPRAGDKFHKPAPGISQIGPGLLVFSPYLRAFQDLKEGTSLKDIEVERIFRCGEMNCEATARVAGKERVTVKGGSFDTTKVIVEVRITGLERGQATLVTMSYWYADSANRYVKYEMRANNPNFRQPLMDMELVSYTPAGK